MEVMATPVPTQTAGQGLVTIPTAGFVAICIFAVLLAAAAGVLAVLFLKKKKVVSLKDCPDVSVVHEQGAREYQEDSFAVTEESAFDTQGLLAVVSDGMGGLEMGDRVSDTVVTSVINSFYKMNGDGDQVLLALVNGANQAVNAMLGTNQIGKSGATLVMGLLKAGKFHYVSVGDSRICLYRDGQLIQLNREHVYRNELLLKAINKETTFQEAMNHPRAAGLTAYLGQGILKYIDLPAQPVTVKAEDKFILMSDGVYNALSEDEIAAALNKNADDAATAIQTAVQAKGYTKQDNYTAIIMHC